MNGRNPEDRRARSSFFENAPSGTMAVNAAGDIVAVNARLATIFGYTQQELINKPYEILLPERLRQRHADLCRHFLKNPRVRLMGSGRDLVGIDKNGVELAIEIGLSFIPAQNGDLLLLTVVEITERKRVERIERLNVKAQSQLQSFENIGVAATVIDQNGHVLVANAIFQEIRSRYLAASDYMEFIDRVTRYRFLQLLKTGIKFSARQHLWIPATESQPSAMVVLFPIVDDDKIDASSTSLFIVLIRPVGEIHSSQAALLSDLFGLTSAEANVAIHFASGSSTSHVADQIGISRETVRSHLSQIFRKMRIEGQTQLVALMAIVLMT